ncbi:MAG: rhodanese-like domain-containing protein [Pseudomonadota bacterium]
MWLPVLLLLAVGSTAQAALVSWKEITLPTRSVVVDARPLADCVAGSLGGARCLPASEFVDSKGRLAPWREIVWLFSTAHLAGDETVLVVAERNEDCLLVAGLLHLAGQKQVYVAAQPARTLLRHLPSAPGTPRDFARQMAYKARFREELIVFSHEFDDRRQARVTRVSGPLRRDRQAVISAPRQPDAVILWAGWLLAGRPALLELPGRTG